MSYTNNSDNTLPMLNINNKLLLSPNEYQLWIGFHTGIGWVGNSNTAPVTIHTVTIPGMG